MIAPGSRLPLAFALPMLLQSPAAALDLQGHRGARGLMPENTLPAFEKALALGVTTLELDTLQRGGGEPSPWLGGLTPDWAQTSVPQAIRRAGGAVWSPYYPDLSEADLQEARRLGLRVVVWTVNEPVDMVALIDLGVDGLITDYPDRARAAMVRRGLALPPAFSAE